MRSLGAEEIHVWPVRLVASDSAVKGFERLLTVDERERAARFRSDALRRTFTLARGTLRILLSRYSGVPAANVRLTYGRRGKPALSPGEPLGFNASHTGDFAMYAFALHCEIGIDVERVRPMDDLLGIAENYFCPEEAAELRALSDDRESAFFRCWTRKEAYVKAIGNGLHTPLDSFRVSLLPQDPPRLIYETHNPMAAHDWNLCDLSVAPDYAATLAYRGTVRTIVTFAMTEAGEMEALRVRGPRWRREAPKRDYLPRGLTPSDNCAHG